MAKTSVFGIVKSHSQAERVVEGLQDAGFPASEISVLLPDSEGKHDIGHVKATKAPEGATTGATAGGVTGGVLGLLAGIGALAIPGIGPFIAAGPIMAALSGAAIGAGTGGLVGALVGMGIPEIEAKQYENKLKTGNYFIAVHADDGDRKDRAKEILKNAGAEDISSSSMSKAPAADKA
ncbi:MAG: DUF3341 domain-containing protein [Chthoniobacterales bacterium]|nr:MAG: DUF3341 domain-containing protein [Chthoniobacterales bacterium]